MKSQPHKKALAHLQKAENFAERLSSHLSEVREYLNKISNIEKSTLGKKLKSKRR